MSLSSTCHHLTRYSRDWRQYNARSEYMQSSQHLWPVFPKNLSRNIFAPEENRSGFCLVKKSDSSSIEKRSLRDWRLVSEYLDQAQQKYTDLCVSMTGKSILSSIGSYILAVVGTINSLFVSHCLNTSSDDTISNSERDHYRCHPNYRWSLRGCWHK